MLPLHHQIALVGNFNFFTKLFSITLIKSFNSSNSELPIFSLHGATEDNESESPIFLSYLEHFSLKEKSI